MTVGAQLYLCAAVFQQLVGTKKANPVATLSASVQMLRHLGLDYHANVIHYAIDRTINYDKIHTSGPVILSSFITLGPGRQNYLFFAFTTTTLTKQILSLGGCDLTTHTFAC
jgi:hypothetical protein